MKFTHLSDMVDVATILAAAIAANVDPLTTVTITPGLAAVQERDSVLWAAALSNVRSLAYGTIEFATDEECYLDAIEVLAMELTELAGRAPREFLECIGSISEAIETSYEVAKEVVKFNRDSQQ